MLINFFLILLVVIILARLIYQWRQKQLRRGEFWAWLALWLIALVVIVFPNSSSYVANLLGVGRGSDLVLYVAVILIFYLLFRFLVRLEKMEKNITKIARKIALDDSDHGQQ